MKGGLSLKRIFFIFAIISIGFNANAGIFGPSNYDECIMENMKGVSSDVAARQVTMACRRKFPEKTKSSQEPKKRIWNYKDRENFRLFATSYFIGGRLSSEEKARISGRIGINRSFFSGNTEIYGRINNGNASVSADSIVINIWNEYRSYKYVLDIFIKPRKTESFSFPFDWPKDESFNWNIYEVYGLN